MGKRKPHKQGPTPEEAARAVFLDFEGRKKEAPSFVGAVWDGPRTIHLEQVVLDERLLSAAKAKGLCRAELSSYLHDLSSWIRGEERVIVAWSERELEVFREFADAADLRVLEKAYRNGIRLAKAYRRRQPPGSAPDQNSLAVWMDHCGYRVPNGQGTGLVAAAILDVRDGLEKHRGYDELTPVMKGKWTRALGHNHHDCLGMRHVVRRMTGLDD